MSHGDSRSRGRVVAVLGLVLSSIGWQDRPDGGAGVPAPSSTPAIDTPQDAGPLRQLVDGLGAIEARPVAVNGADRPRLPPEIVEEYFSEERLRPEGPPPLPDDPPPHEGALIDYPHLVGPPDLVMIEVLQPLEGQPITGERLVRGDGTISIDFYGTLYVRGMTRDEIKIHVIRLLRDFLDDEALGLIQLDPETLEYKLIPPAESTRVFVDVAAYNSAVYYVSGDVVQAGRLVWTGNETVLDVLQYASGLLPTADETDIRLARPARGDRPARVYEIDLGAILEGDASANLQVFPGDRLIVGRDPIVETSVALNRLAEPVFTFFNLIQLHGLALRWLDEGARALSAEDRERVMEGWVDLWLSIADRVGAGDVVEDEVREQIRRLLVSPPLPSRDDAEAGSPVP